MPKQNNYTFNSGEEAQIEQAIRNDNRVEVVQRATALRMLHMGYAAKQVAEVYGVRLSSVYNWRERWRTGGIAGLANQPKPGRRRKAGAAYWAEVEATLEQDPTELGYVFTVWTLERLRDHVAQRTGIRLSLERLRVQMKERGYVWRRPKHDLHALQDAQARADALQLLDGLKKEPKQEPSSYSIWTKAP
jgi:transposase